ncbi:MAG: phenylalanine--tRNA ligase subunit beta [bacterium]|nr:phenylalanine--tRNA ligase subunit beta [bacterium]
MKISYNWLREYVQTDLSPEEMSKILTDTGLEVEGLEKIESIQGGLKGVVIGEVLTCEKHPDADRLKVTTVSIGGDPLTIVCGAPNVGVGQKVVVATVGTTLYPEPDKAFKIKESKIRGQVSQGMLCAEDELGLGESHDGIMVLPESVEVGTPAAKYFELEDDYQIEIGLTPNRSDALGHIGVARDLVAYLNTHTENQTGVNWPNIDDFAVQSNDLPITVSVEDTNACPRYMGTTIQGVKVEASPSWLQNRLRAIGLAPINNVVDVTNFVMHELGTPLHAFDAAKLNGKIVVKTANNGDTFTTLDEVERKLDASNLMITNGNDHLCIAGVFGGMSSGISNETRDVFLESAYFEPVSVRKTAKMHGLNTDASFRYERGVDPNLTDFALKRAAMLIQQVAGGAIAMDVVDTNPKPIENKTVAFSFDRCNRLIGEELPREKVEKILTNLDIKVISEENGVANLEIPAYRVDVTREADVVEEVLRIHGYNAVPVPTKWNASISQFVKPDPEKIQNTISEMLVGMGCMEMMNNSLTKSSYVRDLGGELLKDERSIAMLNPLSQDLDVMRQSLIFNLLETVGYNQNRQNPNVQLFEFGKIYQKFDSGYNENKRLIIGISGDKQTENWNSTNDARTFFTVKGLAQAVLERLGMKDLMKTKALKNSLLQDGLQIYVLKNKVGEIGWVSPQFKKQFGLKNDVFIADLDWDMILDSLKFTKIKFTELPKTFAVRRDFSLLLDEKVQFAEIEEVAYASDRKLLQEVGLFDVYEGKNLDAGKKSYAVSFIFQDAEKTLKDQQVDAIMEKIRQSLESKLGAQLR